MLGSIQHLKSKFGSGYILTVQLTDMRPVGTNDLQVGPAAWSSPEGRILLRFVGHICPLAQLLDHTELQLSQASHFVFSIPSQFTDMAGIFEAFEASKVDLGVEAYGISQASSLERVFISLAASI